jgi:hypothetical protein
MYWSGYSPERTKVLIEDSGLIIESARIEVISGLETTDGEPERHLWVVARKPD